MRCTAGGGEHEKETIRVRWRIPADGALTDVKVVDDVPPAPRTCLTAAVSVWRFPAHE